eukprot:1158194-Pelagomonas_calceolata.AAC.1
MSVVKSLQSRQGKGHGRGGSKRLTITLCVFAYVLLGMPPDSSALAKEMYAQISQQADQPQKDAEVSDRAVWVLWTRVHPPCDYASHVAF